MATARQESSTAGLDTHTGLPRLRDELGASQSSPVLQEVAIKTQQDSSPHHLDQVLRPKSVRDSVGPEASSSLKDLGELGVTSEEGMKRTSSFADLLESRDMDQAWLDVQVSTVGWNVIYTCTARPFVNAQQGPFVKVTGQFVMGPLKSGCLIWVESQH